MKRIPRGRLFLILTVGLLVLTFATPVAPAGETTDHQKVVDDAIARAGDAHQQALALVRLAWPDEPGPDGLANLARKTLVGYAEHALPALQEAIQIVKPEHQADVVSALIEARELVPFGIPTGYKAGLADAMWFGTREARMAALPELAKARVRPAVLPIIDAAIEDPALLPLTVVVLGKIGDPKARFFLEKTLIEGDPGLRADAAVALATIGGRALIPLKSALRSEEPSVRLAAVRALLPVARVDDLSALYSYVYAYPDDDPETMQAVRNAVAHLEKLAAGTEEQDPSLPPTE